MDIEIDVEYLQGNTAIKRKMKQKELAALLLDEDVVLLFVNKPKVTYYRRKTKNRSKKSWLIWTVLTLLQSNMEIYQLTHLKHLYDLYMSLHSKKIMLLFQYGTTVSGWFSHTLLGMGVMLMNTFEVITLLLSFGIFLIALLTYIDKHK